MAAPAPQRPRQPASPAQRQPPAAVQRGPAPVRQIAYDPGYAALGGPAPIIVQAKPSWSRPGSVTGAGVLAFVVAGLCIFAAMFWFTTSEFVDDVDPKGGIFGDYAVQAKVNGMVNVVVALGLVAGAIGTFGRQEWGRMVLIAGAAAHLLYSMYRMVDGTWGSMIYLFLDGIIITLVALPTTSMYLRTRNPTHMVMRR